MSDAINAATKLQNVSKTSILNINGNKIVYPYMTQNTTVNYKSSNFPFNLSGNVINAPNKNRDLVVIKEFKKDGIYVCENPRTKHKRTFKIIKMDKPQYFVDNNYYFNISYDSKDIYSISCEIVFNRTPIGGGTPDNNIAQATIYSNKDGGIFLDATIHNDNVGNPLSYKTKTVALQFPIIGEIPQPHPQTQLFGGRRKSRKSRKSRKTKKVNT